MTRRSFIKKSLALVSTIAIPVVAKISEEIDLPIQKLGRSVDTGYVYTKEVFDSIVETKKCYIFNNREVFNGTPNIENIVGEVKNFYLNENVLHAKVVLFQHPPQNSKLVLAGIGNLDYPSRTIRNYKISGLIVIPNVE